MVQRLFPYAFFVLYGCSALGAGLTDVFAPHKIADGTGWVFSAGWQREIAAFDGMLVVMSVLALMDLRAKAWPHRAAAAFATCSLFIGTNNLIAWTESSKAGHLQVAITHGIAMCAAVATTVMLSRRGR